MKIYRPNKPTGTSPFYAFCIAVWEYLFNGNFPFSSTDSVKVNCKGGVYSFTAALPSTSSPSADWAKPIIYDKTKTYKKGEMIVIRPSDTIVTVGAIDLYTGVLKHSYGGTWKATQDVLLDPSKPGQAYVPVWPLPFNNSPDAIQCHWMLISLWPTVIVECTGTGITQTLTNAQTSQ